MDWERCHRRERFHLGSGGSTNGLLSKVAVFGLGEDGGNVLSYTQKLSGIDSV